MTRVLTYIEIDAPFCANTYGVLPCTASLSSSPPTGTRKCFNTPKTCQDRVNYIDDPVTFRFSKNVGFLPDNIICIPSIKSVSFTPAVVSLGKDLGTRASLTVTFEDHPWPDTGPGFDKYRTERPYNPYELGTFWGKFRARQPFLRGKPLRWIRGTTNQALEDMETRHFVIDSFSHNAADGTYSIVAKDILKLADDDRSQAPRLSSGFLNVGITDTDIQATLQPSGIGDQEYPASGYVAIGGKEIASFTRDVSVGNDANTKLLLHMEGADAATVFTDSSLSGKAINNNGNVQIDVAQAKFGLASCLFDGTGDYLSSADNADWTFAGNFTVDFWARWNALATTQFLFIHYTDANNRYFLQTSSTGVLTFSVVSGGSTIITMASAAGAVAADGTWRHIAVTRNGNVFNIWVNGVSVATVTDADAIPNFTSQFRIGADNAAANAFNGWIDEFRVSHVARWTAPFTPPIAQYQSSSDVLNLVRGQLNTLAIEHDAQDRVQLVLRYLVEDPADIIYDLLVNYAGIDPSYIPLSQWQTETASFLNRVFSADIAEPVGVKKLVSELIEDAALSIWWDDVGEQIRLRVLRAISTDAALFDEGNHLEGSVSTMEQPNERLSQIWRYFAKRNPLEGQDDPDNYRSVAATVDLQAETDYGSSVIHKIYSRWTPFGGRSIADRANALYLSRFRDPPRRFTFAIFRNEVINPVLGQGYRFSAMGIQDDTGASTDAPIQITRLNPSEARYEIEAEEMLVSAIDDEDLNARVITIDVNSFNINLRDLHDTLYPEPTDDDVYNGITLTCIIDPGVIVGSVSASIAAFIVGDWPVGFPITIRVSGRIQGKGGDGGTPSSSNPSIRDGDPGGVALYTRHFIDVEVGQIFGGGGGGGVGARVTNGGTTANGGNGGGGAGQTPGISADLDDPAEQGTTEAGGIGDGGSFFDADGGAGGDPGEDGEDGLEGDSGSVLVAPGLGGPAGAAIDGDSFVTVTVGPGDIRGPQIN